MNCKNCNAPLGKGSTVCPACGTPAASASKKAPRLLIIIVAAALLAAVWFFFLRTDPIKDVKEHLIHMTIFSDESGSYPLGEIVELNLPDANWSSQEQGADRYLVTVSGRYPAAFAGGQEDVMSTITFSVQYIGGTPIVQLVSGGSNKAFNVDLEPLNFWLQHMARRYQDLVYPQPQE